MKKHYYFDYAATTPVDKRVAKAMETYHLEVFGNPGSLHRFGQEASAAVFKARNKIAKLINCDYREVVFTGSATEANNLAIRGIVKGIMHYGLRIADCKERQKIRNSQFAIPRIITSQIEHESILETCRELESDGLAEVIYLPVNKKGIVDLKKLKAALNERTVLVSIMYANNEIGSIQPLFEISKIINEFKKRNSQLSIYNSQSNYKKAEIFNVQKNWKLEIGNWKLGVEYPLLHTDAAQAFNYLDCNVRDLGVNPVRNHARACAPEGPMGRAISNGVDLMTLSSQKIYGPKGVGLLYIRDTKYETRNSKSRFHRGSSTKSGQIQNSNAQISKNISDFDIRASVFQLVKPIVTGGGQEEGLRGGTENVAGIVGFAEAAQIASDLRRKESARLSKLQNYFWKNIKKNFPGVLLNGPAIGGERLPNNINIYFPRQEGLIYKLDMAGIAVSGGSACSARLRKPSHVLEAIGCSGTRASESLRISFGRQTDKKSLDNFLKVLKSMDLHQ